MPSTGYRSSKPPDQPNTDDSSNDLIITKPDRRNADQQSITQTTLPNPIQSLQTPHHHNLWIELLPLGVQYRIAEYVCEGVSGRDALNLAKTTSQQSHAVSVALDSSLFGHFGTHSANLVDDWITAFEHVRVLELWEHPNNFRMLESPELLEVILEDEPKQIEALAESGVCIRRIEFYARYGTPTHIITSMFEKVTFTQLEIEDIRGDFFGNVDVAALANACHLLEKLVVYACVSNHDAVAHFVDGLSRLTTITAIIEGVEISLEGFLPKKRKSTFVTGLGLYLNKVKWFETFQLPTQMKQLWLMSDQGWGENQVLQFANVILELPNLEDLTVKLKPGAEPFFPKISSLWGFRVYWNGEVDLSDGDELYYKPEEGVVTRMIQGMPRLTNLLLSAVRLGDDEVAQIINTVGDQLKIFGVSLDRQDVPTMERLLTVINALTKYASCLEKICLCARNERGIPIYDPCEKTLTSQRKHEMLLHLDRLYRRVPTVLLGHVETFILDWAESERLKDKEKEHALQNSFTFRRCRRGMNESGETPHMCALAKLLEAGCEALEQDREAAIELCKQAVWMGDPGDALLILWRLTEDPQDLSTEPRPGGAFELVLQLDKTRVTRLPRSAEIFLKGTGSTDANPRAAAKLLQLAVDRGFTHHCSLKLANLVRAGFGDVPPDPYRAFDLYKLAIDEHDDPDAMFRIAELLKHGYGKEPRNPASAREYLERGARLGWAPCMNDLAILLNEGYDDVLPDREAAIELYKQAIADGNTVAMGNLASLYVESSNGDLSMVQKAIELYERAISEGQNAHAMLLLGFLHQTGYNDVPPNPRRAKQLFVQATEWGEHTAYTYLGNLVNEGYDDVPPDPDEAMRLYQLGITVGDKNARGRALCAYAQLLHRGSWHVKPDLVKAVELYRKAIDEGEAPAVCHLALLLEEGGPGMKPDPAEAHKLYMRAVEEEKCVDAMRQLGDLLERGYGDVKPDPYKAVELYKKAIDGGDIAAYAFLGDTLEGGYGDEPPDPESAAKMYQKGVIGGDPEAMCALGALLEQGFGSLYPDPLGAIDLYKDAMSNSSRAIRRLGKMLEKGYLDKPPDSKAAMALYKSAAATDPWSKLCMAALIENGYADVEPDRECARKLYREVIDEGLESGSSCVPNAMRRLGQVIEKICEGDPEELENAASWYHWAISIRADPNCLYDLAVLSSKGYGDVKPDVPKAVSLLEESVKHNIIARPFFLLADFVKSGYGDVEPDPERAEMLEEEANLVLWKKLRM